MSIIAFILIFGAVVISHELGHFLLAKKNGIRVNEFSIGMGPTIFKVQKGETKYALRLLPIGGACVFEGEDGVYETDATKEVPSGSFQSAHVWARISCVLAGPLFNMVFAFFLALIIVGMIGSDRPVLSGIIEGYPAEEAGIQVGDRITEINGDSIYLYREISLFSFFNQGEEATITFERDGIEMEATLQPKFDETTGSYLFGFSGGSYVPSTGFSILQNGYYEVRYSFVSTIKSLEMLVKGNVSKDDVAGPVGMAIVIDDAIEATSPYGFTSVMLTMINIALLLSVNLGIINLLPLPALDGGRLVFLLIEAVRGKPIAPEKEGMVHFIGFAALMVLMIFVMFNDLSRIF